MHEFDLYLPSDARTATVTEQLKRELRERFGGVTHFSHRNEGEWKQGGSVYRDDITIMRVLTDDAAARPYFRALAKRLATELDEEAILIVARQVEVI